MTVGGTHPARVNATLDAPLSRWLWLVKWLLVIPHYVVLAFLWLAFVVMTVVAFFAILFTGRFPQTLFEFNVGVLRWSWRVAYYSYGALGTDRYPPFTLAEVADYPAHLELDYPPKLSRGLVLVKWWLLAIPQYLIVSVFVGGGVWAGWETDRNTAWWGPGGLIGLLVIFAAVALTVTGTYPRQMFDLVMGLNRWVLRVAVYAALMTDHYPPFRLDMGGPEAGSFGIVASPLVTGTPLSVEATDPNQPPAPGPRSLSSPPSGWTGLRIFALVAGCLLALVSLGLLAAGGAAVWLDNAQRDSAGYLTSDTHSFATPAYAITSDRIDLGTSGVVAPSGILGTIRFRVTASDPTRAVFIGVAPEAAVDSYLANVDRVVVTDWANGMADVEYQAGGSPRVPPTNSSIWVASVSGKGTQTLTWKPTGGDWRVVVMNRDASRGVSVLADAGATVPPLGWIAGGLLGVGGVLLVAGTLLIVFSVVKASRQPRAPAAG